MNLAGEHELRASRDTVWQAVNSIDVLQNSIPGCVQFEQVASQGYQAIIKANLGPVSARFKTAIDIEDMVAPESYRLIVHGSGGAQGFGEAIADVVLRENGAMTVLEYRVDFRVRGKLAQVGSRLLLNALTKLANDFFCHLAANVEQGGEPA